MTRNVCTSTVLAVMMSRPRWILQIAFLLIHTRTCVSQAWDKGSGTDLSCSIIIWGNQDYYWPPEVKTSPPPPPPPSPVLAKLRGESGQRGKRVHLVSTDEILARFQSMIQQPLTRPLNLPVKPVQVNPEQLDEAAVNNAHCIASVRRAKERCGGKGINFVPTHFWKNTQDTIGKWPERYCFKTNFGDDQTPVQCTELMDTSPENKTTSDRLIHEFYIGMKACVTEAIKVGFSEIKVTPHLDDGRGTGVWRNTLGLDPWRKCHGYSYIDIMVLPLANAIRDSIQDTNTARSTKVMFTLQGEMNFALVAYPQKWMDLAERVRGWVTPAGESATPTTLTDFGSQQNQDLVKVGVSLNFNRLCGWDWCSPNVKINSKGDVVDQEAFRALMDNIDYLGISHYPSVYGSYNSTGQMEFEEPIDGLAYELSQFGVDLSDLLENKGKEFHLSEFGIGGGQSLCGCQAASNVQILGDLTYYGVYGTYGRYPDPWKPKWARDFQKIFYEQAVSWLSNKGGPKYRVDGAYMWSMSSWDVAGIYWTSYDEKNGTYYAPALCNMIKAYNDNRTMP